MRLDSWNLHGAFRSRAGLEKQHRAWAYMRNLRADVVFAQEVSDGRIPSWANGEWTILAGENGRGRKTWRSGSVIAARPGLNLRPRPDALDEPWLAVGSLP